MRCLHHAQALGPGDVRPCAHHDHVATTTRTMLPTASDRIGILSLERARLHVQGNRVLAQTTHTTVVLPTAALTAIFLGPGTSITHKAAQIAADDAVTLIWTGTSGVRAYSTITPLAVRADLFHRQVAVWANGQERLATARTLYRLRFPDGADISKSTMAELRACEGRRVRDIYRSRAAEYGLTWIRRDTDWERSDELNRAITTAYKALYGAALAVIQALGLHPALGFIHTGKHHAFAYDIADLYKTTIGLTVALESYVASTANIEQRTRSAMNQALVNAKILPTMIQDIHAALGQPPLTVDQISYDELELFDLRGNVPARRNYSDKTQTHQTEEPITF